MIFLLVVGFVIIVPFVELWFIVQVGQQVGFVPTIASLIAVSMAGTALVKHEGFKVFRDFTAAVSRGEMPSREIVHGACLLAAGVFLLAPGFMTDVLAILLLLPPVRALVARVALRRRGTRRVTIRRSEWDGGNDVARGSVTTDSWEIIDAESRPSDTDERGIG